MTFADGGTILISVIAGISLAAAAGLRAFVPLLVLSVASKFGGVNLHENVAFLGSDVALVGLSLATALELAADKIPLVDHALDSVSTFVRPAAGFVAGLAVLADLPEPVTIALALFFAMVSLGTHFEHAKVRAGSTALTAGVGNPVISVVEDGVSGALSVLAIVAPLIALVILLGIAYFVWRVLRRIRRKKGPPAVDASV